MIRHIGRRRSMRLVDQPQGTRVIRIILRALGLLASLASFVVVLTARGPSGEPSVLERIPVLMDALEARVVAMEQPPGPSIPALPARELRPVAIPPPGAETAPPPEYVPPSDLEYPAPPRLPTGTPTVKVNRGLP